MRLYLVGILGVLALIEVHTQKEPTAEDAAVAVPPAAKPSEETAGAPVANVKPKGKGKQPRVKGEAAAGNRTKVRRGGGATRKGGKGNGRMRGRPRERLPPGNGTEPARKRRPKTTTVAPQPDVPPVQMGSDGKPMDPRNGTTMIDTSGGIVRRKKKGRKNPGKKTTTAAPPPAA